MVGPWQAVWIACRTLTDINIILLQVPNRGSSANLVCMQPAPANPSILKRFRVLIADDSAAIQQSLSGLISRLNQVEIVGRARTGGETLELIRKLKPDAI